MVMKLLEIPLESSVTASGFADEADAPDWLLPYLPRQCGWEWSLGPERAQGGLPPNDVITSAESTP
ncbi:MAG: hypothetical protein ACLU9S_12045 [Oscillospiraceae bacterium]